LATVNVELLKRLCETPGIPGREDQVRAVVIEELRPLVDDVRVDVMGNVIATKAGKGGPRVMIAAHMDEIGFMVSYVDDHGFIRIHPVGGFDPRVLAAQRVLVHASDGRVFRGALQFSGKPIHLLAASEIKAIKMEELFVDIGLPADEVKSAIEIGDMVTLDRPLEEVGRCVMSKALDDRVSVFVMIEALRALQGGNAEIVAVATTQEEVGLRGARTSAYAVDPDISIALDVTLALDIPDGKPYQRVSELGKGVAIKVMDGSVLSNHKLIQHFRDIAERNNIPYQLEILPRGGTDAGAMQQARAGSAAITISVPTRYVHTVNEMAAIDDIAGAINLLARFLEEAGTRTYGYDV